MNDKELGRHLAQNLVAEDEKTSSDAKARLRDASPRAADFTAKELVSFIKKGGASAEAACRALSDKQGHHFGGKSWARLFKALMKAQEKRVPLAEQAFAAVVSRGPDPKYLQKLDKHKPPASAHIVPRVLSVGKRIWVWVVCSFPVFFAAIEIFTGGAWALHAALGLVVLAVVVVLIDAFLRRCPACKKMLAGDLMSIAKSGSYTRSVTVQSSSGPASVDQTVDTHDRNWRCVSCNHRWTT